MAETRPNIVINDDGVCQACKNYENRSEVDWEARKAELEEICDEHRREDGYYDCLIPVSGGKDSHYLTHIMKNEMNMNPLLVSVADPFSKTDAGVENLNNLKDTFDCDHIEFNISRDTMRKATRIGFEELGEPLRYLESAIYREPIKYAINLDIPLMVYGEDPGFTFGLTETERKSALQWIYDGLDSIEIDWWLEYEGLDIEDMNPLRSPDEDDAEDLDPIFMSYFKPWDGYRNYRIAHRYGFKDVSLQWERPGHVEDYDQIDSIAYSVHNWMKYPKFGYMRATDLAARWVRTGRLSREDAKLLIKERGGRLDQRALEDFVDFCGYTIEEFYDIVDQYWNEDIFEYNEESAEWQLKDPIWDDVEESSQATYIP